MGWEVAYCKCGNGLAAPTREEVIVTGYTVCAACGELCSNHIGDQDKDEMILEMFVKVDKLENIVRVLAKQVSDQNKRIKSLESHRRRD